MSDMDGHEIPQRKRDRLLLAAAVIAACTMLEVWGSWLQIGSVSGFPKFGEMTTGWILPVSTEAYWACALVGWLGSAPGSRSRRFAMWSAAGMFALSLGGQESAHLLAADHRAAPPAAVVGFVSALPLVALALIAMLVHLRRADAEADQAAQERATEATQLADRERAEADERAALRAQVADLNAQLGDVLTTLGTAQADAALRAEAEAEAGRALAAQEEAETARADAERRVAKAEAEAARLTRKLGPAAAAKGTRKPAAQGTRTTVPADFDAQAEALSILTDEPGISGAQLGLRVGKSKRWGQDFKGQLATRTAEGGDAPA